MAPEANRLVAFDDPVVDGVACHFTVPEKGGFKGWIGVAEEVSDISLACRQVGPGMSDVPKCSEWVEN
jgi:catabolite regulation protein CreA